nr:unnamed protein product [Callosobruchus chinensis]
MHILGRTTPITSRCRCYGLSTTQPSGYSLFRERHKRLSLATCPSLSSIEILYSPPRQRMRETDETRRERGARRTNVLTKEEKLMQKEARKGMDGDEAQFSVEHSLDSQNTLHQCTRQMILFLQAHLRFNYQLYPKVLAPTPVLRCCVPLAYPAFIDIPRLVQQINHGLNLPPIVLAYPPRRARRILQGDLKY